jgi:uncharacterized protein YggE
MVAKPIIRGLALAMLVLSATAHAQPAPGAPGHVKLRIATTGSTSSRADKVTILVQLSSRAATTTAARQENDALAARLTAALVARGVPRAAITTLPRSGRLGIIGNAAAADPDELPPAALAGMAGMAGMAGQTWAFSTVRVTLSDPGLITAVRDVLDAQGLAMDIGPHLALQDDRAAKRTATAKAIAAARAEADVYAETLGLKVAAITSVSNVGENNFGRPDPDMFLNMMLGGGEGGGDTVVTSVPVWVDFDLAPR